MTHNYICHCFNWILHVSGDSSASEVMKDGFLTTILQSAPKTKTKTLFLSQKGQKLHWGETLIPVLEK